MNDDFICPMPMKWNDIYDALLAVWRKGGAQPDDKPPVPLILAAWWVCSSGEKKSRWLATIMWAAEHNCRQLIPELAEEEKFRG